MKHFDWHKDSITKDTAVTPSYKNTQNVRRFLKATCGPELKFNRPFMAWVKDGNPKTMGEVAEEWLRINSKASWFFNQIIRFTRMIG